MISSLSITMSLTTLSCLTHSYKTTRAHNP